MTAFTLTPELEDALTRQAKKLGTTPERLVRDAVREKLAAPAPTAHEEWEKLLRSAASPCGVSLSNKAVSSEDLYE